MDLMRHYGMVGVIRGMAAGRSRVRASSSGLVLGSASRVREASGSRVGGVQGQEATGGVEIHFPSYTSEKQKGQYVSFE